MYNNQIKKRWRFRSRVVNKLSYECKNIIKYMLEPDVYERWSVEQVIQSDWIEMDMRLRSE